jgi:hypothetical protein
MKHKLKREDVGEVLAAIYNSELDFRLESAWDAGYTFFLGSRYDRYDDFKSYSPGSRKIEDIVFELGCRLMAKYPDSAFGRYWKNKFAQNGKLALTPSHNWNQEPSVMTEEQLEELLKRGKERIG